MIRVLLVDDQTLIRQGLESLLTMSDALTICGQASDGEEAINVIDSVQPDVVLMDIRMPRMDGIEATRHLRQTHPQLPILILTTFDDHELIIKAIAAGAKGYLLKDVSLETLVDAIRALVDGGTWLQPAITERIVNSLTHNTNKTAPVLIEPLTDKELAVLRLMAAGLSNQEIADSLFKSTGTIKNQVSSIMAKLGVHDRTRAVLKAIDLGVL
ncbi:MULTISPECIES: response regulator transcription factor [Idiomarina]|jgi:DNA-binding NarL/FixJ family response regulator|uniref:DNA-binding response regulator n=2 Tax=Idiomarina baltica TaxID=190892 RepID=A0A348WMR3_9GAMM|nr:MULTISPECIES: response regulator transcription factor [Idiomarina]EAQ32654.1 two-component system regulatory protein [Idiomarina baltica OS145]HAE90538.1 DNA-binding response regulator [Idiomarina sp.]HAR55825.1 DNA-binding response regulator [Idiomarina baltica]|tara:strand:+ start:984 stop:1622 length:639 start_codon:yes stop_codon:yes gene_type:complete